MRWFVALLTLSSVVAGCTPSIPIKDNFGASALAPVGSIPPEFAEFNNYDPAVNRLISDQICATDYRQLDEKTAPAVPGQLSDWDGRCLSHVPLIGSGSVRGLGLGLGL